MLNSNEILASVKEISEFLVNTKDEYSQNLSIYIMEIMDNEHSKNYINFNEAFIIIAGLGNWELAKKCLDIAEIEISLEKNVMHENNHYAHMIGAVDIWKNKMYEKNESGPSLKNKYLYVLEFTNKTVKIGITKEKEKRMKAICSASGMNIVRGYFTEKIDNVQKLETELHRHFRYARLNGEFFAISFEEAVEEVKKRTKL